MILPLELSSNCLQKFKYKSHGCGTKGNPWFEKGQGKADCENDEVDSGKWTEVPKPNLIAALDIFCWPWGFITTSQGLQHAGVLLQNEHLNTRNIPENPWQDKLLVWNLKSWDFWCCTVQEKGFH